MRLLRTSAFTILFCSFIGTLIFHLYPNNVAAYIPIGATDPSNDDRSTDVPAPTEVSWSMAGANPQRTSWVPNGVDPAAATQFGIEWFRPIEAYIGQHIQLITARDKIYVATARGMYALDTMSGDLVWRFDTELPLGNSPTVVGEVVYVGGLDKRIYALNADTGDLIWTFAEAKGGFSTNPLVVDGKVLLGGRDGYFYALDQKTGDLIWQYPARNQDALGPILYSAAYADGKIFFASNDNYGYALNIKNGKLIWKSGKLPGDGYHAWWPVVFERFVIFSSAPPYADGAKPGVQSIESDYGEPAFIRQVQRDDVFHRGEASGSLLGPTFEAGGSSDTSGIVWSWAKGNTVVDASKVTEYLEDDGQSLLNRPTNKPWRRSVIILNIANGREFTFDSDNDNNPEYAPFLFTGTYSGNRYPPLIIPTKNAIGKEHDLLYAQNLYRNEPGNGIPRAILNAWQPGTQYLFPLGMDYAIDEPVADSAGGNMLYQNLCCDRLAITQNLETNSRFELFGYFAKPLESIKLPPNEIESWMQSQAPGYDTMWTEASMYDYYPRRTGGFGTPNGIYHNHGLQNPIIPYKGRLFIHRSNAVLAFGPNPVSIRQARQDETPEQYEENIKQEYPQFARPLLSSSAPDQNSEAVLTTTDIQRSLDREINKILQTGHLRPGYYNSARGLPEFTNYFENPGDTLYTLLKAYPHVSKNLQPALENYIKQHYRLYFENGLIARTGYSIENPSDYDLSNPYGFGQLQPREWMPLPPEVSNDLANLMATDRPHHRFPWQYPQHNFYAMWKYAQTFHQNDLVKLKKIYNSAKDHLEIPPPDSQTLREKTWIHNGFIAGYIGFLKLQEMAEMSQQDASLKIMVQEELDRLLALRSNDFSKDHPWTDSVDEDYRRLAIARNFMYLTPELAEYLRENAFKKVEQAINEYNSIAPYWVNTRYEASREEFSSDSLYTNSSMFQAKAYIMKEPQEQLLKYVDTPAFKIGDLFFIQNLVTTLEEEIQ